jgi:dipeptidyl aminopeptidase/acylaminoacyl peptidase
MASRDSEFTPEDLARLPDFYHPTVSPNRTRVAYYYDVTGRNELHVLDLETGNHRQLSLGEVPRNARWSIQWGGAGDRVFFHRDEDGDEQNDIYAIDLNGNVECVVEPDGQAFVVDASTNGRYLLYASDEGEQLNLYRRDLRAGESQQLTAYDRPVQHATFSPDGEWVAYGANESDDLENLDTYVMAADGSGKRRLDVGTDGTVCRPVDWHPDGDQLLLFDDSSDLARAGVFDLSPDIVEWLGDDTTEERATAFGPDGDLVFAVRVRKAAVMPVAYDTGTGEGRELAVTEGVARTNADNFTADGDLVFVHTTSDERPALLRYDLVTDEATTLLAPEYGDLDPSTFVGAEYVTYESADGLEIGALCYDSGRRPSPAVVMVHGGPHSASLQSFDKYVQFLVDEGYTVLQPNYRGSIGRGREFKNAIHGDWGGNEQADIAAGARWLADREWIDEDRIAVFGRSYGGYSAYMQLVTYPNLWAAAVAWVGMTDLQALYEESMPHFQATLEEQLGDPEENADLWRERSPITHVENAGAPVFVVHGVNDSRCPISQARRFRAALEALGWVEGPDGDFEYLELGEEGHGSTDADYLLRTFEHVGDFLDRRV